MTALGQPVGLKRLGWRRLVGRRLLMAGGCGVFLAGWGWVRAEDPLMPVLEVVAPVHGGVFALSEAIPLVLHAAVADDVITRAEVLVNGEPLATAVFCCVWCPCARPRAGQETTLQLPAVWDGVGEPPPPWRGWRAPRAGTYRVAARGLGEDGTEVEAAAVTITVVDLALQLSLMDDGAAWLVLPEGALVPGVWDLEVSEDLTDWTRLGAFSPGAVAAFYRDPPSASPRGSRFYRAVYTPPAGP